jgi:hypothetical protein
MIRFFIYLEQSEKIFQPSGESPVFGSEHVEINPGSPQTLGVIEKITHYMHSASSAAVSAAQDRRSVTCVMRRLA